MEKRNIKKQKLLIGIISGIVLLVIVAVVLTIVLTSTKELDLDLYKVFDNMKELDSYKVIINRNEYDKSSEEYEQNLVLENIIEKNTEKTTDTLETRYFYNDKRVESKEYNGEEIWYYPSEMIYLISEPSYRSVYNELFSILKEYKFVKNGKTFEFKNEQYVDEYGDKRETLWDLQSDLKDILITLRNTFYYYSSGGVNPKYGVYNTKDALKNIKISVKDNKISDITLVHIEECYDENDERLDCSIVGIERRSYNLKVEFSDFNNTKVEVPKEVINSLEKTTAGDWVGTYRGNIICSDGNSFEETLELTDTYKVDDDIVGWQIKMKGYSCDNKYYTYSDKTYNIVDNKIIVFNLFGEVVAEFEYKDGKIIEYDKNNNIIDIFEKE